MRFLKIVYRYPKGHLAQRLYNLGQIVQFQLVARAKGHSMIYIETVGDSLDIITFKTAEHAQGGFKDLSDAVQSDEQTGVVLRTGFVPSTVEYDEDDEEVKE